MLEVKFFWGTNSSHFAHTGMTAVAILNELGLGNIIQECVKTENKL